MHASVFILCAWVLGLAVAPAAGAVRPGELEVRQGKDGMPCFTIPQAEEERSGAPDFRAISVVEAGPGAKTLMWSMEMPQARTFPVTFRMCIPYAGRLPVLPQTPARALQTGRPYDVTVAAAAPQQGGPRLYRARFCLLRQGQDAPRVRHLGAGGPDGKARLACVP